MAVDVAAILHTFADLAPQGAASEITLDVTRNQGLAWLGTSSSAFTGSGDILNTNPQHTLDALSRLAAFDELHRHEHRLREGWVFVAGRTTVDGQRRELCLPLLSAPVRLGRGPWAPSPATIGPLDHPRPVWSRRLGDREITALVADPEDRGRLGDGPEPDGQGMDRRTTPSLDQFPSLQSWIQEVVEAAGLTLDRIVAPTVDPRELRRQDELVAIVGGGIYAVEAEEEPQRRRTLRDWASRPGLEHSAAAIVYGDAAAPEVADEPVVSPFPLTAAQRRLVVRSRHEPLSVASGAPGTGKSHAVAAIAVDAVLRGESVLVATQSHHAAAVLADLLDRHPGPTPVVFGNGERRDELLDELTERLGRPIRDGEIQALDERVGRALDEVAAARHLIERALGREAAAASLERWEVAIPALVHDLPRVFDADADLDRVEALNHAVVAGPSTGWFATRRHRRGERQLAEATGGVDLPHRLVADAVAAARARRAAIELETRGGVRVEALWDRLREAESGLHQAVGARAAAHDRLPTSWTNRHRRSVASLLTALRAGRGRRRRMLAELDLASLVHSVPLWVGNLYDIEDLLPSTAATFDLVVLDEASQIDQPYGALALLRARRAVVVGDPRQLRHVSFIADADVQATLEMRGLGHLADRLDLRRVSTFDAAAAAAPVTVLDEHHRSVPHLIEFSARRFYRGGVQLLTRHPATHAARAIDLEPVEGNRDSGGVNRAQVERALELVRELGAVSGTTVGIVTPFRAQADALEAAILDRFGLDEIIELGLRTGTVHAFQGGERDVVVLSLALDDDSPAGSQRFVEDPSLFNVMITRARRRVVVLSSQAQPSGILGDYLDWAASPPSPPPAGDPVTAWSRSLGAELERSGRPVLHRYPVGRWEVDLVAGDGEAAIGIECGVHHDGPSAHIERHLNLTAAGWTLIDAFPSRWGARAAQAAVELDDCLPARKAT